MFTLTSHLDYIWKSFRSVCDSADCSWKFLQENVSESCSSQISASIVWPQKPTSTQHGIQGIEHLFLWWVSTCSEPFRLLVWRTENTTSGQGSSRERSPVGSRFPELLFLDVPGTAMEQVRTCGFRRNSSSLDKASKIHDSVRLNSLESFLVTLPSISSETWEMYFWAIPGPSVFCDWLFLIISGVSLETAAKFLLFLNVAMILFEKVCQLWRLNWFFNLEQNFRSPPLWGKRVFNESKQLMISANEYITKSYKFLLNY